MKSIIWKLYVSHCIAYLNVLVIFLKYAKFAYMFVSVQICMFLCTFDDAKLFFSC